jgi:hypothetical protein
VDIVTHIDERVILLQKLCFCAVFYAELENLVGLLLSRRQRCLRSVEACRKNRVR